MKIILAISGLILMTFGIFSCKNQDWTFPDYDYTSTYFSNQYPVRTLVFGEYEYDNSRDKKLQFIISASMGGDYSNENDINVGFEVDNTLTNNLFTSTGTPIIAMPANYYSLSDPNKIIIPNGKTYGGVTVQLTDAFLSDTNAITAYYVIPLKITSSTTDSVLSGRTLLDNPDPRIASNWSVVPKNFTLFGVKYVNEWHGKYLLRGTDVIKAADGSTIETITYHAQFLEKNTVVSLLTSRKNQVKFSNSIKRTTGSPGSFEMKLDYDTTSLTATISNTTRYTAFPVTGTAKMVKGAESWNDIARNVIYLDYQIKAGTETHFVKDTLVFRDKAVKYEEFTPRILVK